LMCLIGTFPLRLYFDCWYRLYRIEYQSNTNIAFSGMLCPIKKDSEHFDKV
jgi:hypothetical protein